jgi:hypothetical protein
VTLGIERRNPAAGIPDRNNREGLPRINRLRAKRAIYFPVIISGADINITISPTVILINLEGVKPSKC